MDWLVHTQLPRPCCFEGEKKQTILCLSRLKLVNIVPNCSVFFSHIICISVLWLLQGWTSVSEISTEEASGSERPGGWRWATSPQESVIRWNLAGSRQMFILVCLRLCKAQDYVCLTLTCISSFQISERVFTLETQQGQQVAHDEEVQESGLELCCVPAPDFNAAWKWRIRDGVLETR